MKTIPFIEFSLYEMFLLFSFWSFIGWIIEVIDIAIETGKIENRGFLHIPFCPMYGFGVLVITILLRDVRNDFFSLFIGSAILCTVLELAVGMMFDKLFHKRWWDYSHMKFNYKGLICLRNTVLFGLGCVFVERIVEPAVERRIEAVPEFVGLSFITIMCIVIIIDLLVSLHKLRNARNDSNFHVSSVVRAESDEYQISVLDGYADDNSEVDVTDVGNVKTV